MKTFYSSQTIRSLLVITLLLLSDFLFAQGQGQGRVNVFELMERRDLRLSEIDAIARKHFDGVGRERGTGHKQYERWKFEMQFHLDDQGYQLPAGYDAQQYQAAASSMETPAEAGAWTESGPTTWNRTSGWNPGVGRIISIAVAPSDTTVIYITTPGGGIWKSSQGGNQWAPLADYNNSMMTMYSVTVHPTNPDFVLAGNTGGTIYKSTDGGYTWTSRNGGAGNTRKIIFHPTNQQIIYAVGTSGISKSIDGGNTFVNKLAGSVEDIEFQPGNPDIMIASGTSILRSSNAGENWIALGASNGVNFSARTLVSVSPNNPQVVYAVQANSSEFGRLLRSDDGGNTFITTVTGSATGGTNYFGYETTGTGTGGQASYDMAMTVNPLNANEVHIAGIICWKSTNGGISFGAETAWSLPNSIGYNHADVHVLEWVGKTIYSGSDGGIYKSTDLGDNWTDLTRGLGIRQFYRIAVAKTDAITLTGGAQDNGSSVMRTTGWVDWLGADGMDCLVSPLDAKIIFGTSQYGSLYRTLDGGNSRTNLAKPENGAWVTPLAIESNSNNFYAGFVGVYKYTNNGASYTKLSGSVITSQVSSLAVAPSNSNYIYASTGTVLYVTKDGGATWTSYTVLSTINSIAVHPTDPEKLWITCNSTSNRVLVSINAGVSFTNISGNLPAIAARSVKVDDTGNEGIYAALNIGVYYTNKNMTGWINLTDNLPQVAINEIEIHNAAGKLRIGTYGRGAWERALYTACSSPVSLTASNITNSEATVNWAADATATGYNVEYKTTATSTWNTGVANTQLTSYTITGLSQGSSYDWRVNIICSSGTSEYAASAFTTTAPCIAPVNLQATNIASTTATISWSAASGATGYDVETKLSSASTWTVRAAGNTSTTYNLTGLSASSAYDWRVRTNCGTLGGYSTYAQSQLTTIAASCTDNYESNNTNKQAKSIGYPSNITASIGSGTDVDWFKFTTTTSATKIRITLSNLPADYDVYLYDKSMREVGRSTQTGTTSELVIYNGTVTRTTYYIKVQGANSSSFSAISCYSLILEASSVNFTPSFNDVTQSNIISPQVMEETSKWKMYPNPARGLVNINFSSSESTKGQLQIIDMSGKILQNRTVDIITGSNFYSLDLKQYVKGIYMIRLNTGKKSISNKLLIQ